MVLGAVVAVGSLVGCSLRDRGVPWLLVFPGAAMAIAIPSLNFVGDGVRDAVDPRTAHSSR